MWSPYVANAEVGNVGTVTTSTTLPHRDHRGPSTEAHRAFSCVSFWGLRNYPRGATDVYIGRFIPGHIVASVACGSGVSTAVDGVGPYTHLDGLYNRAEVRGILYAPFLPRVSILLTEFFVVGVLLMAFALLLMRRTQAGARAVVYGKLASCSGFELHFCIGNYYHWFQTSFSHILPYVTQT